MSNLPSVSGPYLVNVNPFLENMAPDRVGSGTPITAGELQLSALDQVLVPMVIAQFRIWVTAQAGNIDVGVWSSDQTTLTLLTSSGVTVVGVAGEQVITLLAKIVVVPGVQYYIGICPSDVTAQFGYVAHAPITAVGPIKPGGRKAAMYPLASNAASLLHSGLAVAGQRFWMRVSAT